MSSHKAIPFQLSKSEDHALLVQLDKGNSFYDRLHYHPQYQITAIEKGEGVLYAGNAMTTFSEKDVILIGSNVPHLLKNSSIYYSQQSPGVSSTSLFFDDYSFGRTFFEIRELNNIRNLLSDSRRVIKITGNHKNLIYNKIISTASFQDERLIINYLEILSLIDKSGKEYLNSAQYHLPPDEKSGSRLNEVLHFTFSNYSEEIRLDKIARIAHLSISQFSHFFKIHTGKSYIRFLNELRIENACVLLLNPEKTVEQTCFETGFQNQANFTRQFKKIKNTTPSAYRRLWIKGQ